eukprot:754068-Hanusia_phi.AAC.4
METLATWALEKESAKKMKNLFLRWNMGQETSCLKKFYQLWNHAVYSQISFSNRLKRAAFMRSKFSLISVKKMIIAWRRLVDILATCRKSFKEKIIGHTGICFEQLVINARQMTAGKMRLQNVRGRGVTMLIKRLFESWRGKKFEEQDKKAVMKKCLSVLLQKNLHVRFQWWASVAIKSRKLFIAQTKMNLRCSRSHLKLHFFSLAEHARVARFRRRRLACLQVRLSLRLLLTWTSAWRAVLSRLKVVVTKSSSFQIVRKVRMQNSALRALFLFADRKAKARQISNKIATTRKRSYLLFCWYCLHQNLADAKSVYFKQQVRSREEQFAIISCHFAELEVEKDFSRMEEIGSYAADGL